MSSNLPSLLMLLVFVSPSAGQVLTPPIFNLARSRHIEATSTCGRDVSDPELFCQLTGGNADKELKVQLIQGQVCDVCDPMDPERSHPAEYAIDGTERWWQSPPLSRGSQFNEVNLTIDMGQEFHVAYVFIRMANSPRPGVWVLERSRDHGVTFEPWAYFADTPSDCESYFGPDSLQPITEDDSVRCYTQYSKVVPLEGGEIPFSLLNGRPSASTYINSSVLQQWTRANSIRLRLLRAKTLLGHLMSVAQQVPTVTRRYYYSVKDISIGGRCVCNGHADLCDPSADDEYKLLCRCQHHTCGPQCEQCCPPYVQKSWQPANYGENFTCEPCNCHGHSAECVYDPSVDEKRMSMDIHEQMRGGGVCQNCGHFTTGINCDQCQDGYYRPYDSALNDTDVCQQCSCDVWYSTGNCLEGSGQCECRVEYQPPDCTQCSYGYYGYPDCQPCDCHLNGTRGRVCEVGGGQCPCKPNFTGKNCDQCSPGYFNFPECQPCECNPLGSVGAVCDLTSGQCDCLNNYGERRCQLCQDGYFSYPDCQYCNCDSTGTEVTICDKQRGLCLCREGYGGQRCDRCSPGFYGYPSCQPCGCNEDGSTSTSCSVSGKCQCLPNFAGQTCHQCSPGFFNFPECLPCNCQPSGSIGVTCSGDGVCQCRPNFDGQKCGQCQENFYNFPLCEGCNCDPRGVTSSFAGCGSLEHLGELCECKPHVTGRICDTCRPLYWNLMLTNPNGCQECECNLAGTVGGVSVCDVTSSQCTCKPHVTSLQCGECRQGSYRLQAENVLGCQMCDCDVGGSLNEYCDQYTGQCSCRPRINGSNCSQPLQLHYFPTLFQHQYEAEDGRTPAGSAVRFGYDESRFPDHSWRGYAVFSPLQREIIHDVWVEKPSLYRLVMRYVNPTLEPIIASVKMVPESPQDIIQNVKVRFEPTRVPALVTASGDTGDLPSPLVLNPGRWTVTTHNQIEGLLLDYLVILPSAYYEASILQERAREPCRLPHVDQQHDRHRKPLCVRYAYPDLQWAARAPPTSARTSAGPASTTDQFSSSLDSVESLLPLDSAGQSELEFGVPVDAAGRYVLLVDYLTPPDSPRSSDALPVRVNSVSGTDIGSLVVNRCDLTTLCRQVVIDDQGRVGHFGLHPSNASITLATPSGREDGDGPVLVHSVVAVPSRQWHMDYILPKPLCIKQNKADCIHVDYPFPPQSTKIEFESSLTASGPAADTEAQSSPATPAAASPAAAAVLVPLNADSSTVDVRGQVSQPGPHVLIVHYRQPDHPEFEVPVLLQNGRFYEGTLRVSHCPFVDGCRAVVEHGDRNKVFDILENYMLTLQSASGGDDREVLLDYVYAVPAEVYSWQLLEPLHTDRSAQFLEQCAQNNFMVDTDQPGFCHESVFSLTADYNNGALECDCDGEGSLSFECDQFGGQCPCRPGVIGRRCNICTTGYFGFPECRPCDCPSTALCDDLSGECICPPRVSGERCDRCVALTYGFDPLIGCEECSCNVQGVVDDNLQCNLLTGQCPCKENIVSRSCDRCRPGHWAFPYCQQCSCDVRGTTEEICSQETSECFCKDHAVGQQCDQCLPGTFNLAQTNPDGCTRCFCFGKTDSCTSGFLYWTKTHRLRDLQWGVVGVHQSSSGVTIGSSTVDTEMVGDDGVLVIGLQSNVTHYLRLSPACSNLLATYGGLLNYTIVLQADDNGVDVSGADVILVGSNMTLLHYAYVDPQALENTVSVRIEPRFFRVPSGTESSREQLMQVLSSVDAVYLKVLYWDTHRSAQLSDIAWSEAVPEGDPMYDPIASTIEECSCPDSYTGLSCEDCAAGHYRAQTGPFGGYCVPCNCHSHSGQCDPITGTCLDCQHNTTGDHCERCVTGYHGNATRGTVDDCRICACPIPTEANNFAESCELSADGRNIRCECRPGYTGLRCESCAAGFHGQPELPGDSCRPCSCSGNIDPSDPGSCDSVTGQCLRCLNDTGGPACNLCARHFYGDAVALKDCQPCTCDKCGTSECVSYTGSCTCNENVEGLKCDRCAPNCWDFNSCQGCRECDCGEASESTSCDLESGQCRCRPGAAGRRCDLCAPGFWNYSPAGCQSCNCNEEYAYGVGCNPQTGQCECLPGVEGPKCDRCPYRWVLIHGQGCKECDSCVHDLLDSTDDLQSVVQPIMSEFESYAGSYFINQKLSIINSSYYELKPQVAVIAAGGVDINPLELQVSALERQSKSQQIQSEAVTDRARETQRKAAKVRDESRQVEEEINEAITMARNIVRDIISLAQGLKVGAGPQIDLALTEAQSLLDDIRSRDLGQPGRRVEDELQATIELLERVRQFSHLVSSRAEEAAGLRDRLRSLEARLEDLRNQSQTARQQALQTLQLVAGDRVSGLNRKVQDIGSISEAASSHLDDTATWLERARALLAAARSTLQSLRTQSERVLASQQALQIRIDEMNLSSRDVEQTTRRAQQHAIDLMIQAQMLDSMLADTRSASEGAVRAANSYQDIVAAINAALTAARAAVDAAEGAGSLSDGVGERALQSRQLSEQLFARANSFMTKIVEQLQKQLDSAKIGVDVVKKMNERTREQLLVIDESLEELERYQLQEAAAGAAEQAAASNRQATDALQRVSEISDQLPAQLEAANALARQMEGARKAVQLATEQVERVEGIIPNIQTLVKSVDDKFNVIEVLGKDVGDKIAELRRKVAVAREKANSIGVGVEFDGGMTLQLHNPEGLERSATANDISFHFRTQQPNGFLMYLGNEVGTKELIQRTTSDDYMSAEVINGNLNVLVDLGSGAQRIINDAVYVSDGVWRKVIISRKGRQVKVRVVSEGDDRMERVEEVESILPGSKSALNLNQAKSVLHIGGFPTSAKVQDNVRYTTFTGAIEDMRINGVPVGLWNFDSQTNVKDKGAMHRDKLVKLLPASGLRFNGAGYAAFSTRPYTFSRRFSIQMRFKTFTADGLLFLAGRGMADFLSVELTDGAVVYQYSLGDGAVTLRSTGPYNDGAWHTVEASRQLQEGVLKVDSVIVDQGSSPGGSRDLSVSEMMYFGGYPASVPYAEVTDRDFEGCLTDVYISGSNVNLGSNEESLGVFPGCPNRVVSDVSFEPQNPGYVAQPISNERFQQLTLKFKTTTPDGLLMYAANDDQAGSLSLSLNAGNLVLAILPGGQISTANFFRYNDDQWHVVTATMTNDHVRLEIDDYETFTLPIPPAWLSLSLGDIIYFGGLPSSLQLPPNSTGSADNLAGCLGDVTFNGEFVNFADSRERPNALMERCVLSRSGGADAADGATSTEGVANPTLLDISTKVEEPELPTEPKQLTDEPPTSDVEYVTPPVEDVVRTTLSPSGGVSLQPAPISGERCMLPIEPVVDQDVDQYSGHRFGNSLESRWEFSSLPGKYYTESAFSVEIRTTAQEGVIFYAAAENQIDFLALYLKGGNVVYAFDCGSGHAVVASNKAYNDGEWHTIGFDRAEKEGKLYIDGDLISTGVSVGSSQNVQVDFPVFLGGLPDALKDNERLQGNLEKIVTSLSGCIRNARLNGREFGAASNAVTVSPCSDKVEPGVFFSEGDGYLVAGSRFRVGLEVDITLDIKSRRLGGVLLSVYGKKDYLILQMLTDGSLSLTVENGRGEMVSNFTSPTKHTLCDGQWHSIRVVKVQNVATMSVDGFTVQPVFGVPGVSSTDTNSALFIGGAPERYTRGRAVGPHFVGCIRNLVIQGRPGASLKYAKTFGAVTANTCPLN